LATQYPAAYSFLVEQLKTTGQFNKTGFLASKNMTIDQSNLYFANQDIFSYFKDGFSIFEAPVLQQAIFSDGLLGYHGVPQMPIFMYKAIADEVSRIQDTDALVDKYCAVGASILYQRNTIGGHVSEDTNGDPRALEWLSSTLNGMLHQRGCLIQNIAVNITSSAL
jgi:hypothetical protein